LQAMPSIPPRKLRRWKPCALTRCSSLMQLIRKACPTSGSTSRLCFGLIRRRFRGADCGTYVFDSRGRGRPHEIRVARRGPRDRRGRRNDVDRRAGRRGASYVGAPRRHRALTGRPDRGLRERGATSWWTTSPSAGRRGRRSTSPRRTTSPTARGCLPSGFDGHTCTGPCHCRFAICGGPCPGPGCADTHSGR
jgi:hypothetical protein